MVSHLFLNLKMHTMREDSSLCNEIVVGSGGRIYLDPIRFNTTLDIYIADN